MFHSRPTISGLQLSLTYFPLLDRSSQSNLPFRVKYFCFFDRLIIREGIGPIG